MDAMKRFSTTMLACVMMVVLSHVDASAQGQIITRREKIKDFTTKITKVVIPDDITGEALKEGVMSAWTVSPYEFCSQAEFEAFKGDANYYFLLLVKGQNRKESEPGIKMLTIVKGGAGADKGINDMLEVVSFPLCSADLPSGRELVMIPAILKIMQNHAASLTDSELKAYMGLKISPKAIKELSKKKVYISEEDLAPQVTNIDRDKLCEDLMIVPEDEADSVFNELTYNAVVGYVVAPNDPVKGSSCYKMIFTADTHEILYYKKHNITARNGKGFLPSDLAFINGIVK